MNSKGSWKLVPRVAFAPWRRTRPTQTSRQENRPYSDTLDEKGSARASFYRWEASWGAKTPETITKHRVPLLIVHGCPLAPGISTFKEVPWSQAPHGRSSYEMRSGIRCGGRN